jgi:hypothetical protein
VWQMREGRIIASQSGNEYRQALAAGSESDAWPV